MHSVLIKGGVLISTEGFHYDNYSNVMILSRSYVSLVALVGSRGQTACLEMVVKNTFVC